MGRKHRSVYKSVLTLVEVSNAIYRGSNEVEVSYYFGYPLSTPSYLNRNNTLGLVIMMRSKWIT
jgi:hypothetical protein